MTILYGHYFHYRMYLFCKEDVFLNLCETKSTMMFLSDESRFAANRLTQVVEGQVVSKHIYHDVSVR